MLNLKKTMQGKDFLKLLDVSSEEIAELVDTAAGFKALKKAAGFIRRELGMRVDLRYTPELLFERDRNIAYGVHIAKVLADAQKTEGEYDEGTES